MTPEKLHADLSRLQRVLTGQEPSLGDDHLVPVTEQRMMLAGTTVVALQTSFRARPSGLLVPTSTFPEPLDSTCVYLTVDEVYRVQPEEDWVEEKMSRILMAEVVDFVASTLTALHRPGVRTGDLDGGLAEAWFSEPVRTRVNNLLREPHRILVAPQALMVMLKLACFYCPDEPPADVDNRFVVPVMLAVASDLHAAGDEDVDDGVEEDTVVDTEVTGLTRHLVANQHFNSPNDEDHLMARFTRRWLELPTVHARDPKVVDLPGIYRRVTGVHLADLSTVAMALWASVNSHGPHANVSIFDQLGWSATRLEQTLRLFCIDTKMMRDLVTEETSKFGLSWSFSTFEQFPVLRRPGGLLTVLDPDPLLRRVFGWLPLFDVIAPLKASEDKLDRVLAAKFESCVRHLGEVYAHEVLTSMAGGLGRTQRLYGDQHLKQAFTKRGRKIADAAIDYGDAWVVIEVTTSQLTRGSVAGISDAAVSDDLNKLVKEVEQIDGTIRSLRENESALTAAPGVGGRTFYPLLVVAEGFPINPLTITILRARVAARGLLSGPNIAALEVVNTVELEMLEGLQETGGPGLRQVLESKRRGALANCSVRDYLLKEQPERPTRSRRVTDLMNKAFEPVLGAYRPADVA